MTFGETSVGTRSTGRESKAYPLHPQKWAKGEPDSLDRNSIAKTCPALKVLSGKSIHSFFFIRRFDSKVRLNLLK